MAVYLTDKVREEIQAHGERGFPNEICGLLVGKEEDGRRVVNSLVAVENSFEAGEQFHRYLITPEAMLKAERMARREGVEVLGVYHSHPNAPAIPSEYDRDHAAWTTWSYIIVSVREGRAAELRAWKLRENRGGFDEEEIK